MNFINVQNVQLLIHWSRFQIKENVDQIKGKVFKISVLKYSHIILFSVTTEQVQDILGHITEGVCRPFKVCYSHSSESPSS